MLQALPFWPLVFHPRAEEFGLARSLAKSGKVMRDRDVGHESENVDVSLDVNLVFYRHDTCRRDDGPCLCPCLCPSGCPYPCPCPCPYLCPCLCLSPCLCPCPYFCPCPFRPHIAT